MSHPMLLGVGSPVSAPWTPTTPGNLLAWWKADVGLTLSGSRVTTWADQSGNGHDLTEFSSLGPTYNATGWNGTMPTVTFGGPNVFLRNITTSISSYPNGTGTPLTIFVTCQTTAKQAGALLHWFEDPGITDTYTFGGIDISGGTDAGSRVYDGIVDRTGTASIIGRRRIAYTYDGTTLKTYVDSVADLSAAVSITKTGCNRVYMGAIWNLTQLWAGDITEMVVYSAAKDAHVSSYQTYSTTTWGG